MLDETIVQRYLKVVSFYLTMFIVLQETLCNVAFQENVSILLWNVKQSTFPAEITQVTNNSFQNFYK